MRVNFKKFFKRLFLSLFGKQEVLICVLSGRYASRWCERTERRIISKKDMIPFCELCPFTEIDVCEKTGLKATEWCEQKRRLNVVKDDTILASECNQCCWVEVELCDESHFLPNRRCPARPFLRHRSLLPSAFCPLTHRPTIKKIYWLGVYDVLTAEGSLEEAVKRLSDLGDKVGWRIFGTYAWGPENPSRWNILSPWKRVGLWNAGYPEAPPLPFYDQLQWNDEYWEKLERLYELFKREGVRHVWFVYHDFCSFKMGGWMKYRYPFLSSSPDRDILKPEAEGGFYPGGFWGFAGFGEGNEKLTVQWLHRRYIERHIALIKKFPFDALHEFCNEDEVKDWDRSHVERYYEWLRRVFEENGVSREKLVLSGRWEASPYCGLYAVHGISKPTPPSSLRWPQDKAPSLVILSSDGGWEGTGEASADGKRGIGSSEAEYWGEVILREGFVGFEELPRGVYAQNPDRADLNRLNLQPAASFIKKWSEP